MRVIQFKVYPISEHPNKEACLEWIRYNWHDLNQYSVEEVINSIKALSEKIGGTFDYCIGQVPDRGEYIIFEDYDKEVLNALNPDDLPLTGVCWDYEVIEALKKGNPRLILDALHKSTEWVYSEEGLTELCEANEYEFYENGKFV